jgi:hypothetical protein
MRLSEPNDLDALSLPVSSVVFIYFLYGFADLEVREATEDGATDRPDLRAQGTRKLLTSPTSD